MTTEFSPKDVEKIASLARLRLQPEEIATYSTQLGAILGYVEMLNEVDTEGVEPMAHAIEQANILRDDVPTPMFTSEEALANAPKTDGRYFLVPKIIDAESA